MALSGIGQGIEFFQGDFEDALSKARAEKKQVFVDVYTSWCAPCRKMAKEVFSDAEVGKYFNAHFVCLKLEAEKEGGNGFFKRYQANGYPGFFWLDEEGELLDLYVGFVHSEKFIKLAEVARQSKLGKLLGDGEKRWERGERTPELVREYVVKALGRVKPEQVKPMITEYLAGLSEEQLQEEENYRFLRMFMREAGDNFVFRTLMKNAGIYQRYEKEPVFWIQMYRMVVRCGILYRNEPAKYREYLIFLESLHSPLALMYRKILDMEYLLFQKDFDRGIPEASAIIAKFGEEHSYLAGQFMYTLIIAGFFQETVVDEGLSGQVIAWAEKALEAQPSKESLLYLSVAYARRGDYKKAYQLLANEPFFPEPILSNALYRYLDLPVIPRE